MMQPSRSRSRRSATPDAPAEGRVHSRDKPAVRRAPRDARLPSDDEMRPVYPAKGVVVGLALSTILWALIVALALMLSS